MLLSAGLCCAIVAATNGVSGALPPAPVMTPPLVVAVEPARDPAPMIDPATTFTLPRLTEPAPAQQDNGTDLRLRPDGAGGGNSVIDHLKSVPLEAGGLFAGITALGVANWKWGSSGFRFHSEGWFGRDTSSFGSDKLGHAYSTYVMTEFLGAAIRRKADNPRHAQLSAAAIAIGLMTYVEIFDGFSVDHGFSWEDMLADGLGAAFSVLRHEVPGLNDKLDFRLEYIPSGNVGWKPITDYSGQRYILAVKLAGFKPFEKGPLRWVELHGGYYARGFTEKEKLRGVEPKRALFVGIGLNLQQLISRKRGEKSGAHRAVRSALEYVQVPYTAAYSQ